MKQTLKILTGLLLIALPATAEETTGLTDDVIKIGVMAPFSGNAASYSKAQIGMMAYNHKINDEGGVHGRKLVAIEEDTACDPAKALAAAKKLIYQDEVFMLHGNSCSGAALAIRPIVEEAGLPWVIAHAASGSISNPLAPNIFHGLPTGFAEVTLETTATPGW